MQKITTFFWFDSKAEEAAEYYVSIFKNSEITNKNYYGKGAPLPEGTVLTVSFRIEGQEFTALNGGPVFKFSQAISLVVTCETQEEIDYLWEKLSDGGEIQACGWLIDKYGITWQIIPANLKKLLDPKDKEKAQRVMSAINKMVKLDIKTLEEA